MKNMQFQMSYETRENRFPKVFKTVQKNYPDPKKILSFGCSTGLECFTLRGYFPEAEILGYDISTWAIKEAVKLRGKKKIENVLFTSKLREKNFDVIFAMMVFFSIYDPIPKEEFDESIVDLAGRLNLEGIMAFHNLEYDFMDTPCKSQFVPIRTWKHENNRNKGHEYFGGVYRKVE